MLLSAMALIFWGLWDGNCQPPGNKAIRWFDAVNGRIGSRKAYSPGRAAASVPPFVKIRDNLPPLDGSGVILLVLSDEKALAYMDFIHSGPFGFVGIFVAWKLLDVLFSPAHCFFVSLLYPGIGYH